MKSPLHAAIEYGPLAVFFLTYWLAGLFPATAAIMAATVLALVVAWVVERRLPKVPLISGAVLMVFGGLTLWLHDETFVKVKPTIVYLLFAAVLLGGLAFRRPLLKPVLGGAWRLDDRGWTLLTARFGLFFVVLAALNEAVWRSQTTDFWVIYKVVSTFVLIPAFSAAQVPLLLRHQSPDETPES